VTTAVLSLDATVVLLTPVVFATAARLEVRARPHVYACTHLANSASLLLPVSNLTNLLAFAAMGLGIVVTAVTDHGLGRALAPLLPAGTSALGLPALLAVAALAAALANVCNNLPAVLVLLPLAAPSGAGAVLAVLLGVNIGPNLTYTGSLATLLWRRVLRQHGSAPDLGEFTRLGLLTVPAALVLGVLALWGGLHLLGG
jgi:arsenical pump membrane protein